MKVANFGDSRFSISSLSRRLSARVVESKTISGQGLDEATIAKFLTTCVVLSDIERDKTKIKVWVSSSSAGDEFDDYRLSEYRIDPRFKGLLLPREVNVNAADYTLLGDMRLHYGFQDDKASTRILAPGDFEGFQRKFVNQFKDSIKELEDVEACVARQLVSDVTVLLNADCSRVHTDATSEKSVKLPVLLNGSDELFEEDFFDVTASKYLDKFTQDFVEQFLK